MKAQRLAGSSPGPISVVVVALAGSAHLKRCLRGLARQIDESVDEIIVPHDERLADVAGLRGEFPGVIFLGMPGHRTYGELRTQAVHRARGTLVALTEDHCTAAPDWCARIREAHGEPHAAIGGAVEKETDTPVGWALYLADYGRYMLPLTEGPATYLTDCNVSYKAAALRAIAPAWATEFHETVVHDALRAQGHSLWLCPRIVVVQQRAPRLGSALRERYAFGRLFASTRLSGYPLLARFVYAGLCPLLVPILLERVVRHVARGRRHWRQFGRALPVLVPLTMAWAAGELTGYATGRPGRWLTPRSQTGRAPGPDREAVA
jgi:hypothetical protein